MAVELVAAAAVVVLRGGFCWREAMRWCSVENLYVCVRVDLLWKAYSVT